MKIINITTYILRVPLGKHRFYSSQCAFPERNSLLVKVETDEGIIGWGEGGQYGPPEPVASCINNVFAPMLIGKNPIQPIRLWEDMYHSTRDFGQKGSYIEAISAIDIALWDIFGKYLKKPIHCLLGGAFRESIAAYATGCYYRGEDYLDYKTNLSDLINEAKSYMNSGFGLLKAKIGLLPIEQDIERISAIKEGCDNKVKLLIDCNHAYNTATAIRVGKELEKLGVLFMEEPVIPEDRKGYNLVRNNLSIAIAGGECEYTRYGFNNLISEGCIDIAQPDLCVSGGISEWIKISSIASANGVWVIPHVWGSGIAIAAALHVLACTPLFPHTANPVPMQNEPVIEYDRNLNPLRDELLTNPFIFKNGRVSVPNGNGLGIEINTDVLNKYCDSLT